MSDNYFPSKTAKFLKSDVQLFGNPHNPALKESSPMAEILLFTRRNDSSMKQADLRDIFKKA
jgi:hypothetical protein